MNNTSLILRSIIKRFVSSVDSPGVRSSIEGKIGEFLNEEIYKLSSIKTLLYRSAPKSFYDIYIPITVTHGTFQTDFRNPDLVLENYPRILITGEAGSGKTTLCKHIALRTIQAGIKLPIYIEFRSIPPTVVEFEEFIYSYIFRSADSEIRRFFESSLYAGEFIFILDGYEESPKEIRYRLLDSLESFIAKYSKNNYILSSRAGTELELNALFTTFYVNPLTQEDIFSFIRLLDSNTYDVEGITNFIFTKHNYLSEFAKNPLLLTILILIQSHHIEIPDKKSLLYSNVFEFLYQGHDRYTKTGYVREKSSGLSKDQLEKTIEILAYTSYFTDKLIMSEGEILNNLEQVKKVLNLGDIDTPRILYDLSVTLNVLSKDALNYCFNHISFQEYFAGKFISELDGQVKPTFYKNGLLRFYENHLNISYNLWDVLLELDHKNAQEYFFLPILRDAHEKILNKKDYGIGSFLFRSTFILPLIEKMRLHKRQAFFSINMRVLDYFNILSLNRLESKLNQISNNETFLLSEDVLEELFQDVDSLPLLQRRIEHKIERIIEEVNAEEYDFITLIGLTK